MTRTIESPIIGIPITIIYATPKEFASYFKKYIDDIDEDAQGGPAGYNGMVSLRQSGLNGQFKIFVWLSDNGDKGIADYGTIIHESFHITCRIRECMYGLSDELELNPNNEEDWAYLLEEVSRKMFRVIESMQKQYDKKHGVKADVIQIKDKQG